MRSCMRSCIIRSFPPAPSRSESVRGAGWTAPSPLIYLRVFREKRLISGLLTAQHAGAPVTYDSPALHYSAFYHPAADYDSSARGSTPGRWDASAPLARRRSAVHRPVPVPTVK
jgi:hypothetical protein